MAKQIISYKYATKRNKYILIEFIRSHYSNVSVRDILKGVYQVVCEDGFLIGVLYELAKDKLYRMKQGLRVDYVTIENNEIKYI